MYVKMNFGDFKTMKSIILMLDFTFLGEESWKVHFTNKSITIAGSHAHGIGEKDEMATRKLHISFLHNVIAFFVCPIVMLYGESFTSFFLCHPSTYFAYQISKFSQLI